MIYNRLLVYTSIHPNYNYIDKDNRANTLTVSDAPCILSSLLKQCPTPSPISFITQISILAPSDLKSLLIVLFLYEFLPISDLSHPLKFH